MPPLFSSLARFQHAARPRLDLCTPYRSHLAYCQTLCRLKSSSASSNLATTTFITPRWLSELKHRIGKCILFGLKPDQADEAGHILKILARDWRTLLAGSEGFLVGENRAGLERHKVVWGDMVGLKAPGQRLESLFPIIVVTINTDWRTIGCHGMLPMFLDWR